MVLDIATLLDCRHYGRIVSLGPAQCGSKGGWAEKAKHPILLPRSSQTAEAGEAEGGEGKGLARWENKIHI